jgi:pathogenesis-related protein 1
MRSALSRSMRRGTLRAYLWAALFVLAGCGINVSDNGPFGVSQPQSPAGAGFGGTGGVAAIPGTGGTVGVGGAPAPISTGAAGVGMIPGTGGVTGLGGAGGKMSTGGTGGMGTGGMGGTGGIGTGGMMGMAGVGAAGAGTGGMGMTGGPCGSGTPTDGRPTTGPLACIVEQHNAVRAMVMTATPLPPVTWSADLAAYAQQWTDMTCSSPRHRTSPSLNGQRLGENLYAGFGNTQTSGAGKQAVDGWAGEVACYTFGTFMSGDKCDMTCTSRMSSDGCGHYTQIVWRTSIQIGCGVTTCGSGLSMQTEVICNYAAAGNFIGMNPY